MNPALDPITVGAAVPTAIEEAGVIAAAEAVVGVAGRAVAGTEDIKRLDTGSFADYC